MHMPRIDEWSEDPEYPRFDWRLEVLDGGTQRGYWDWVDAKKEEKKHEEYYARIKGD
jgi:hypothetical protein